MRLSLFRVTASFLLVLATQSLGLAAWPPPGRAPVACARDAAFAADARTLSALEADTDLTPAGVIRRSVALETIAGDRTAIADAAIACPGESPVRMARAIAHADLLRLWARTIALRAIDSPIYPSPYVEACHPYDLESVRLDARQAWVDRDDTRGAVSRADLWHALGADPIYVHVALIATTRLRDLDITSLPSFDSDETAWLGEAQTALNMAQAALPQGEHCGPTYALFDVEPETAAFAPLRHREDGTRVTAQR